jgi:hypothetical protein
MYRTVRVSLAALLALLALLLPAHPAAASPPLPSLLETGIDLWFQGGITDGLHIVWVDHSTLDRTTFRLLAHSSTRQAPLVLSDNLASAYYDAPLSPSYALSDGQLLWIDSSVTSPELDPAAKLVLTDLDSGASRLLAQGRLLFPGIDSQVVTWWQVDDTGNRHLLRSTLAAAEPPADLLQLTGSFYGSFTSKMSSHWVVWAAHDIIAGGRRQCWSLYALSLDNRESPRQLGTGGCIPVPPQYDLAGDTLAYVSTDGLLHVFNLATGQDRTSGPHNIQALSTNGRYVFLLKDKALWGFDPRSECAFLLRQGDDLRSLVYARRDALLWAQGERLGVSSISQLLPISPRPPADGYLHFSETNHNLGGAFRTYWSRNGGLPVFGFPLTEEFMQKNASDEKSYTVQYLERQRYEYHPENAGTPYEVLLGRLGAEALAPRGVDWQNLPKASPTTPHYYPQTGQAIDPLFWDYWRSHGLELGDAGVSEREALALWGYPLTGLMDEQLPDGSTIKVQWYERARFEYHPENRPPYNVLLGRLAAERAEGLFQP